MLNLDTHIPIYALNGELTNKEKALLSQHEWSISGIVLWELAALANMKSVEVDLDDKELIQVMSRVYTWPISIDICRALKKLDFRSDPADELIAATSLVHQVPLLTRDKVIGKSRVVPLV